MNDYLSIVQLLNSVDKNNIKRCGYKYFIIYINKCGAVEYKNEAAMSLEYIRNRAIKKARKIYIIDSNFIILEIINTGD